MSKVESSLTHLEARLRAIFEQQTVLTGIPRKLFHQLIQAIFRALQNEINQKKHNGSLDYQTFIVPDQYIVVMPADQANILFAHPEALDRVADELENHIAQKNLKLIGSPIIRVVADPGIKQLHILLEYSHSNGEDSYTNKLDQLPIPELPSRIRMMPKSFLIVNGLSSYPLNRAVINIGSDPLNQLVLNDPGIAPTHAQIRFSSDHFAIFNLDFVHGTYVNGMAVSSHILNTGDVIHLAGVPLVYGQDTTEKLGYTQEMPVNPPALEIL